jgi:hypothetical protein
VIRKRRDRRNKNLLAVTSSNMMFRIAVVKYCSLLVYDALLMSDDIV